MTLRLWAPLLLLLLIALQARPSGIGTGPDGTPRGLNANYIGVSQINAGRFVSGTPGSSSIATIPEAPGGFAELAVAADRLNRELATAAPGEPADRPQAARSLDLPPETFLSPEAQGALRFADEAMKAMDAAAAGLEEAVTWRTAQVGATASHSHPAARGQFEAPASDSERRFD